MTTLDLDNEPCPIGQPGETWGAYWKRRERQDSEAIVKEYGRHEAKQDELVYRIECGTCGGSVATDGDWFWHDTPGIDPDEEATR